MGVHASEDFDRFEAMSFDCYGTLIDWEAGIAAELGPWAARHGVGAAIDDLVAAFGAIEHEVEAERPTARYPDVLAEVLRRIGARHGVPVGDDEADAFGASVGRWPAFADSPTALARLHERFRLVILSNVDRQSFAASNERLGVTFDLVVTAEDVGSYKPDAANFAALVRGVEALGIATDRLLHVAQSLFHDHEPARRAGLATAWIDRRRGRTGFGATPPPSGSVTPDWTFASLAELADAACGRR